MPQTDANEEVRKAPYASRFVTCGGRELHYLDWHANPSGPHFDLGRDDDASGTASAAGTTLIALHGVARQCRDFDAFGAHFSHLGFRVVCPTYMGRGLSSFSQKETLEEKFREDYNLSSYAQQINDLADTLGLHTNVHLVGTSNGGLISLILAAGPFRGRVRSIVLNDIAPEIDRTSIERIRSYTQEKPVFGSLSDAERHFRKIYSQFGPLSDDRWSHLTTHSVARMHAQGGASGGNWTTHYDQSVFDIFSRKEFVDHQMESMWSHFDSCGVPLLILHGVLSDLLTDEICAKCEKRGKSEKFLKIRHVQGIGHTPQLDNEEQWGWLLEHFLAANEIARGGVSGQE